MFTSNDHKWVPPPRAPGDQTDQLHHLQYQLVQSPPSPNRVLFSWWPLVLLLLLWVIMRFRQISFRCYFLFPVGPSPTSLQVLSYIRNPSFTYYLVSRQCFVHTCQRLLSACGDSWGATVDCACVAASSLTGVRIHYCMFAQHPASDDYWSSSLGTYMLQLCKSSTYRIYTLSHIHHMYTIYIFTTVRSSSWLPACMQHIVLVSIQS